MITGLETQLKLYSVLVIRDFTMFECKQL